MNITLKPKAFPANTVWSLNLVPVLGAGLMLDAGESSQAALSTCDSVDRK